MPCSLSLAWSDWAFSTVVKTPSCTTKPCRASGAGAGAGTGAAALPGAWGLLGSIAGADAPRLGAWPPALSGIWAPVDGCAGDGIAGPLLDSRGRGRREGGAACAAGAWPGRPGLEWLGCRQRGDGRRLAGRSFRHGRPLASGIVVQQSQAHDRRDDQGKRQGQPAHGALLELLLVASGGWFCHRFPRSLFLAMRQQYHLVVAAAQTQRERTRPLGRPQPGAAGQRMARYHSARCGPPLFLSPGRHAILMNFKDCEEAAAWQ